MRTMHGLGVAFHSFTQIDIYFLEVKFDSKTQYVDV